MKAKTNVCPIFVLLYVKNIMVASLKISNWKKTPFLSIMKYYHEKYLSLSYIIKFRGKLGVGGTELRFTQIPGLHIDWVVSVSEIIT